MKKPLQIRFRTFLSLILGVAVLIGLSVIGAAELGRMTRPKPGPIAPRAAPTGIQDVPEAGVPMEPSAAASAERARRIQAEETGPLPARARIALYSLVEPGENLILLGPVAADVRAAEKLDESCAIIPGRWTEMIDEYDRFVHVRYEAGTPRQRMECPTGTSFYIRTSAYRSMDRWYAEMQDEQDAERRARERFEAR